MVSLAAVSMLCLYGDNALAPAQVARAEAYGVVRYEQISVASANPKQLAISTYLSRRYRIASDAIEQLVGAAHTAGQQLGVDPLLILSVIAIESRFNPIAESEMGAKGLMQVMPQYHQDKLAEFGGKNAVLDPRTNILIGARILKDCIRRGGGLEAGLQLYAGAFGDPESLYAQKVMAERDRLDLASRRTGPQAPSAAALRATSATS
jgi:soluble lytic murein transglycosylase-like protein